jgi:hypothetical protein
LVAHGHRHPIDDQQAIVDEHQLIRKVDVAREHLACMTWRNDVGEPLSDGGFVELEQALGLVVDERNPSGLIGRDRPLADAVQHRLALLEQRCDLVRLEIERLPLDPAREQYRTDDAEQEPDRGRDEDDRQVGLKLRAHVALEEPDRDEADDSATRPQRHLCADRLAERTGLDADVLSA